MTNNQLTSTHLAVKSELDGYKIHASRGQATAMAMVRLFESIDRDLEELQERRKVAMDSEPVADVVAWSSPNEERKCDIRWRRHDVKPGPLYRHAQPAPVAQMVPEEPPEHLLPKGNSRDTTYRRGAIILGWKLCRAAMLAAAPQEVKGE